MTDDQKPTFRLITNPDPKARDRLYHSCQVRDALRQATANLMRLSRGTGDSIRLYPQVHDLLVAMQNYFESLGEFPTDAEVRAALDHVDPVHEIGDSDFAARQRSLDQAVRGALQIAASKMLAQIPQQRSGEKELRSAIAEYAEATARVKARFNPGRPARKRANKWDNPKA